ncbi:hypothetical protein [Nocardia africana]|uniref:Minor tail protein n=1 Tax=Nocardia africana TaxID=134964 RepID=A0A378X192_9NOCA|nr:hypothetical protein [Nocardia africana]MCC3311530.1 hypothetical protein [Nocardia africana]SUA47208.1 Uncharacterised protein [Nocardia africana]
MSVHADPEKAYVWLDGDGYRAPAGTAMPTDPFAVDLVSGAVHWDPFGGIEAGFELTPTRDTTPKKVWNRRRAPYKVVKSPTEERMKMRCVDYSVASTLTALQGGSISETSPGSSIFAWNMGDDEDFALVATLRDEDGNAAFYSPRVTLTTPPPRTFGKEDLDGFEFELLALDPFIPLTSWNPLWGSFVVTLPAGSTGGTWTLGFGGQTTSGIANNAANSAVQSALEGLSSIGTGNATVTGSAGGPYTVLIKKPGQLTADGSGLTPSGTVKVDRG